jgi:hypothetical protein
MGSVVGGCPEAVLGTADDHAGQECPECHRHTEHQGGADGDAQRDDQHGEREQLARVRPRDPVEHGRDHPRADQRSECDQGGNLHHSEQQCRGQRGVARRWSEQRWQQHRAAG